MSTHYQTLGIPQNADFETIRQTYRNLARARHPDKPEGSLEQMVALNLAYEVLRDPDQRAAYDQSLSPGIPLKKRKPPVPMADPTLFILNVFRPIDARVRLALRRLHLSFEELAYDPYDDRYVAPFEEAVRALGKVSDDAVKEIWASNWPDCFNSPVNLYLQGLRHLDEALEDFTEFLSNYDIDLIVEGREFLLAGAEILEEASSSMGANR
ncbi:MAG TPA: hypothetical protein DD435_09035 [Cyanobacteria bacterium UBA8530]|nr:hypothetical protein [Cyanobacteria bacterium UBA8530]